eukprot:3111232-Amphidinium_carterae.4
MKEISSVLVVDCISTHVEKLKALEHLSETDVLTFRNTMKTEISEIPCVQDLLERREVSLTYRGWQVKYWSKSLEDQVAMALQSAVRGWLSQLELIPALPGENVLTDADSELKIKTVDPILVRDAKRSRDHLGVVLAAGNVKDGSLVKAN